MQATPTVLVIDDDESVREMLAAVLASTGYRTLLAESGERGLRLAETDGPAVVLCDGCMPGMSGAEVAAHLRSRHATAEIPIIMMSGKPPASEEVVPAGEPLWFLQKPFTPLELVETLNAMFKSAGRDELSAL
jgi:CheY-like chemotaxis protein